MSQDLDDNHHFNKEQMNQFIDIFQKFVQECQVKEPKVFPHILYCAQIFDIITDESNYKLIHDYSTLQNAIGGLVIQLCAELYGLVDKGLLREAVVNAYRKDFMGIMSGRNSEFSIGTIKKLILVLEQIKRIVL